MDEMQMKEEVSQHRRNSQQPTRPVTSVETPKTPLCPRTSWGRGRPPRSRQLLSGQVLTVAFPEGEETRAAGRGRGSDAPEQAEPLCPGVVFTASRGSWNPVRSCRGDTSLCSWRRHLGGPPWTSSPARSPRQTAPSLPETRGSWVNLGTGEDGCGDAVGGQRVAEANRKERIVRVAPEWLENTHCLLGIKTHFSWSPSNSRHQ